MKPILARSEITGAVYIVTKYKILDDGVVDAIEKCDVTDQFDAMTESLRAENAKLRELAREVYNDAVPEYPSHFVKTYQSRLVELGVEVEQWDLE